MTDTPAPSSDPYTHPGVRALIERALDEDLQERGDLTCQAIIPPTALLVGTLRAKASGVVCGLPMMGLVCAAVAERLAAAPPRPSLADTPVTPGRPGVQVSMLRPDGSEVEAGDVVLVCRGDAATLLIAERTALNICQHLSGIASMARRYARAVAGTRAAVFDTRKTTPGLRLLEKHAVVAGGCRNHRIGLYDQILIKDNHIAVMLRSDLERRAGSAATSPARIGSAPAEAVRRCRAACGPAVTIEVEIELLDDLVPVMEAGADIVLLDNMAPALMATAVARRDAHPLASRVQLEASGGITLETLRAVAETGVDRISVGALTHSVQALDLSLRCHTPS